MKKNKALISIIIALAVIIIGLVIAIILILNKSDNNGTKKNQQTETIQNTLEETTQEKDPNDFKKIAGEDNFTKIGEIYYQCISDYDLDKTTVYAKQGEDGSLEETAVLSGISEIFTNGESLCYIRNTDEKVLLYLCNIDGKNEKEIGSIAKPGECYQATMIGNYLDDFYLEVSMEDQLDGIYALDMNTGDNKKLSLTETEFMTETLSNESYLYENYVIGTVYHTSPGSRKEMVLDLLTGEIRTLAEECAAIHTEGDTIYYVDGFGAADVFYTDETNEVKIMQCKFDGSDEKVLKNFEAPLCSYYYFDGDVLQWTYNLENDTQKTKKIYYKEEDDNSKKDSKEQSGIDLSLFQEGFYTEGGTNDDILLEGGVSLEIQELTKDSVSFEYTVIQSPPANRIASIVINDAEIKNGVVKFTFDEDGWFNRGKGTLTFNSDGTLTISTKITHMAEDAMWSIGEGKNTLVFDK